MRLQVKDFMSSPVTTAVEGNSVKEVRALMKEKKINAIPVISYSSESPEVEMTIRGIITATDISNEINDGALVKDIMTAKNVLVVHANSSANAAAKMMMKHQVHHMIVMDDGKIEGMLSSMDFVKLVAENAMNTGA